jgi:hypothetical protein
MVMLICGAGTHPSPSNLDGAARASEETIFGFSGCKDHGMKEGRLAHVPVATTSVPPPAETRPRSSWYWAIKRPTEVPYWNGD